MNVNIWSQCHQLITTTMNDTSTSSYLCKNCMNHGGLFREADTRELVSSKPVATCIDELSQMLQHQYST